MAWRRPNVVKGPLHIEIIAGDAGTDEAHRPVFASRVAARCERGGVEADDFLGVQPGVEVMDFFLVGRRVVISKDGAGMAAAAAVAGQLYDGKSGRLGPARREYLALVPLETPQGRANAILPRVNRDEFDEVRMERFIFV